MSDVGANTGHAPSSSRRSRPSERRAVELSTLDVAKLIHDLHALILKDVDCSLSPKQIRSPDVNLCLIRPLVYYIRDNTPAKAAVFAILVNMLAFQRAAEQDLAIQELHKTRANVCEVVAIKLLKHLGMRDLIDAMTFDFSTMQGESQGNIPFAHSVAPENNRMNALEVAILARAKEFTASPLVQEVVNQIWRGNIVFFAAELDDELLDDDDDEEDALPRTVTDHNIYEEEQRTLLRNRISSRFAFPGKRKSPSRRASTASIRDMFNSGRKRRGLSDEELRMQLPKVVNIYNNTTLELGLRDVFRVSRLRVPRYQYITNILIFAVFIALYTAVVVIRPKSPLDSTAEITLDILVIAYTLDEIQQLRASGIQWYLENLWNIFDVMIYLTFVAFMVLRFMAMERNDEALSVFSLDLLACIAVLLWPRLFAVLDGFQFFGTLLITLKHMLWDMTRFFVLLLVFFIGWLQALYALASAGGRTLPTDEISDLAYGSNIDRIRHAFSLSAVPPGGGDDLPPANSMAYTEIMWLMLKIFFGSQFVAFDVAADFHPIFGPVLMTTYVAISTLVLMTLVIAIMTQSFADIVSNAKTEFLFSFTLKVLEHIKSDQIYPFLPPFNLFRLAITPMQYVIKPKKFTALMRNGLRISFFPVLLGIFIYEWHWNRRKDRFEPEERSALFRSQSIFTPFTNAGGEAVNLDSQPINADLLGQTNFDPAYASYNTHLSENGGDVPYSAGNILSDGTAYYPDDGFDNNMDHLNKYEVQRRSPSSELLIQTSELPELTSSFGGDDYRTQPASMPAADSADGIIPNRLSTMLEDETSSHSKRKTKDSPSGSKRSDPITTRTSAIVDARAGGSGTQRGQKPLLISEGTADNRSGSDKTSSVLGDLMGKTPDSSGRRYKDWFGLPANAKATPPRAVGKGAAKVTEPPHNPPNNGNDESNMAAKEPLTADEPIEVLLDDKGNDVDDVNRSSDSAGSQSGSRHRHQVERNVTDTATGNEGMLDENFAFDDDLHRDDGDRFNSLSNQYADETGNVDNQNISGAGYSRSPDSFVESARSGHPNFQNYGSISGENLGEAFHRRTTSEPRGSRRYSSSALPPQVSTFSSRMSSATVSPLLRRFAARDTSQYFSIPSNAGSTGSISPAQQPVPWSVQVTEGYKNGNGVADAAVAVAQDSTLRTESMIESMEGRVNNVEDMLQEVLSLLKTSPEHKRPAIVRRAHAKHKDRVSTLLEEPHVQRHSKNPSAVNVYNGDADNIPGDPRSDEGYEPPASSKSKHRRSPLKMPTHSSRRATVGASAAYLPSNNPQTLHYSHLLQQQQQQQHLQQQQRQQQDQQQQHLLRLRHLHPHPSPSHFANHKYQLHPSFGTHHHRADHSSPHHAVINRNISFRPELSSAKRQATQLRRISTGTSGLRAKRRKFKIISQQHADSQNQLLNNYSPGGIRGGTSRNAGRFAVGSPARLSNHKAAALSPLVDMDADANLRRPGSSSNSYDSENDTGSSSSGSGGGGRRKIGGSDHDSSSDKKPDSKDEEIIDVTGDERQFDQGTKQPKNVQDDSLNGVC